MINRYSVKFAGESGQGINTLGKILSKCIKDSELRVFAYREYPSLIRGGYASYQLDISEEKVNASTMRCNLLAVLDKDSFHKYIESIYNGGILLYDDKDIIITPEEKKYIKDNNIILIFLDTKDLAIKSGGEEIMSNVVMLAYIAKILKLDIKVVKKVVKDYFSNKKDINIEAEMNCIASGYAVEATQEIYSQKVPTKKTPGWNKSKILSGNDAIALGAISAGVRAYYAYPMTPATSILKTLGDTYKDTGILIKQAENEIGAVQMALGSMYMGTRALTATSGGGFDLMTETISCSGMSETPLVIVLAQRIGPGTGVPTWSGAGDLNAAIRSGHGEFPRCVISVSDAMDSYELIQDAFNIADKYQLPVIILTEKQISESLFNIKDLPKAKKIDRGFTKGDKRYQISEDGVSPRWKPEFKSTPYLCTSDEHTEDGSSTEDSTSVISMMEKRNNKLNVLKQELPDPKYYGCQNPDIVFVGYGSVKNTILDCIDLSDAKLGYLHYEYIYPIKTEKLLEIYEDGARIIAVENNQMSQLSSLIKEDSGFEIADKLTKFDGRPFFIEDILDYIGR